MATASSASGYWRWASRSTSTAPTRPERTTVMQRYARLRAESPVFALHAKTVVVDSRAVFIGTYNLDPRSENLNTEVGVVIHDPCRPAARPVDPRRPASREQLGCCARRPRRAGAVAEAAACSAGSCCRCVRSSGAPGTKRSSPRAPAAVGAIASGRSRSIAKSAKSKPGPTLQPTSAYSPVGRAACHQPAGITCTRDAGSAASRRRIARVPSGAKPSSSSGSPS